MTPIDTLSGLDEDFLNEHNEANHDGAKPAVLNMKRNSKLKRTCQYLFVFNVQILLIVDGICQSKSFMSSSQP